MESVKECYLRSLEHCPPEVSDAFLSVLETLSNTAYLSGNDTFEGLAVGSVPALRNKRQVTLSSMKVFNDGLTICEKTEQEDETIEDDSNKPAKDICEPLRSFEEDEYDSSTTYILQKSCRNYDIITWADNLQKCVAQISKEIGLKDPDNLTVEKVLQVFEICLKDKGGLECRPKARTTFKLYVGSVLNILRVYSVKSDAESCLDHLTIENIATCMNHLHLYLVVKYHASVIRNEEAKSLECLKKTCTYCDSELLKNILIALDQSINKDKNTVNDSDPNYTVCEPDDLEYIKWSHLCEGQERETTRPDQMHDSNIVKKSFDTEYKDIEQYDYGVSPFNYEQLDEYDYIPDAGNLSISDYQDESASTECDFAQYIKYLELLFECQRIRMEVLIRSEGNNCLHKGREKSLEFLAQCLLETRESKLPCLVNDQDQVKEYLTDLSIKLDTNRNYESRGCPLPNSCFESEVPVLSKCSNVIYNQLNATNYGVVTNTKRQTAKIVDCLKSVWPYCSPNVSLLSLPSIYVPLGIGLDDTIKERQDQVCLSAEVSSLESNLECTTIQKKMAIERIYECLERIVSKVKTKEHEMKDKLHWEIIPFTVCVQIYPILECRLKDYNEYMAFMQNFLYGIKLRLQEFVQLFDEPSDIKKGETCVRQFTAPNLDKCLSLLFGFMGSFHAGSARASDYPSGCVEDIFGVCGDLQAFHLFMSKSMNISLKKEQSNEVAVKSEEVCIERQQDDFALHPCSFNSFVKSLQNSSDCSPDEETVKDSDSQLILELCNDCVLQKVEEMCFYDLDNLKRVIGAGLSSVFECLTAIDIKDKCIENLLYKAESHCILKFHAYTLNIKNGAVMKAIKLAREFYHCLETVVGGCSTSAYKAVFNLYSKISGLESISNHKKTSISEYRLV